MRLQDSAVNALHDEYRCQAEYCRRMAERAPAAMKADWLGLAQDWLAMVKPENRAMLPAGERQPASKTASAGPERPIS